MIPDVHWAFAQYEAVRETLPAASFPERTERFDGLDEIADRIDTLLLDAFGVLNIGETAIPGAVGLIARLRDAGKTVCVVSNSASVPSARSYEKFRSMGFDFSAEEIVTSRDALKAGLAGRPRALWGVMAPGNSDIAELGVETVALGDDAATYGSVDGFILLGSAGWTDARQDRLASAVRRRARPVLVGNPDIVAPREHGMTIEPGYYAHDLARRTGCRPVFFGKPFANVFDLAATRFGPLDRNRTVMVGDTLHTDVLGGAAYGLRSALIEAHGLFAGTDATAFSRRAGIVPDFTIARVQA